VSKKTVDKSVIFVNEKGDFIVEKMGNGAQKVGEGIAKLDLPGKAGILKDGTVEVAGKIKKELTEGNTGEFGKQVGDGISKINFQAKAGALKDGTVEIGQNLLKKANSFFGSSSSGSSRYFQ